MRAVARGPAAASGFLSRLRRAARLPLRTLVERVRHRAGQALDRRLDRHRRTYARAMPGLRLGPLWRDGVEYALPSGTGAVVARLAQLHCAHQFDLLGSGWMPVRIEDLEADREGRWLERRTTRANLREARRLWRLVDAAYQPLDWHLDFKSGHRWPSRAHAESILPFGNPRGVDIKVPWELARCQHLPQLAVAYRTSGDVALVREFRNQVLDFAAQNPPRFGVNWACTMDVAIRAANWVLARELFRAAGAGMDETFEQELVRGVYEHARHIATHLEWNDRMRGNHYLADVCGLLFAAAALPSTRETDLWLAFAIQEILGETRAQFHEEGANFEASTAYHRLAGELVVYSVALILGLPETRVARLAQVPKQQLAPGIAYRGIGELVGRGHGALELPEWFAARVGAMAAFAADIVRTSGAAVQIGDNDSGRLFKLPGSYQLKTAKELRRLFANLERWLPTADGAVWPDEDALDFSELIDAIGALQGGGSGLPAAVARALAGSRRLRKAAQSVRPPPIIGDEPAFKRALADIHALAPSHRQRYVFALPSPGVPRTFAYARFGLYGWRADRWRAWLRCGSVGQGSLGGHAHNDGLGLELEIDGAAVACDPGTYVYTPFPEQRDFYRSAAAHFVPRIAAREPAPFGPGLFALGETPGLACLFFSSAGFVGVHEGFGRQVMRIVCIGRDEITVEDGSWGEPLERCLLPSPVAISPKYGALLR